MPDRHASNFASGDPARVRLSNRRDARRAGAALAAPQPEASDASAVESPAPYLDALQRYAATDPVRLMVPGHKGGRAAPGPLTSALGPDVLALDVPTLIPGIDIGPAPTPLDRASGLAAAAWGARRTWFLLNGASQGNLAACLALRAARGRDVIVQRNVHGSVVSGLILAGLRPHWLLPEIDDELGIAHGVTPAALEAALAQTADAVAAIVVAPTYHGAMPDVRALAEVTHAHGAALVVDEAWGAHLAFHPALPEHAIAAGADLVISSTHKSLGSLSGSAMLHHGPDAEHRLPEAAVSEALALTETTSPSALALASLDAARARAVSSGRKLLSAPVREIAAARRRLARIPGVRVVGPEVIGAPGVQGFDPLRLTVDLHGTGRDAREVAGVLDSRSRIALEFATDRLLVAAFGIADGELGAGAALCEALVPALLRAPSRTPRSARAMASPQPGAAVLDPREAWLSPRVRVPAADAVGRIAAETLSPYPPGIPTVLPGEQLTPHVVAELQATVTAGAVVRGAVDGLKTIAVVDDSRAPEPRRTRPRPRAVRRQDASPRPSWSR